MQANSGKASALPAEVCRALRAVAEVMAGAPQEVAGHRVMATEAIVTALVNRGIDMPTARRAVDWGKGRGCLRIASARGKRPQMVRDTFMLRQIADGKYIGFLGPHPDQPGGKERVG